MTAASRSSQQHDLQSKKVDVTALSAAMFLTDKTKQQALCSCLFALCIGNMMMQNVASFLPTYINEKKWSTNEYTLDSSDVSLIISIFSIAQIIFAPFNARIKNWFG